MTSDDIIRMARKAGMERCHCEPNCHLHTGGMGSITTFANLVAAAEREACAKILDDMAGKDRLSNYFQVAAIAIRARGQQ